MPLRPPICKAIRLRDLLSFAVVKRLRKCCALILLVHAALPLRALDSSSMTQDEKEVRLERRISKEVADYDNWKAGLTKNIQDMQQLRKEAELTDSSPSSDSASAQEALAKFGDPEQIGRIACEFYHHGDDTFRQFAAAQKFERIGGYASIRILAEIMLDPNSHSYSPPEQETPSRSPARMYAIKVLAKLVPELDIPIQVWMAGTAPSEDQIRDWYDWIADHRNELSRLQPAAASIPSRSDCQRMRGIHISLSEIASLNIAIFAQAPDYPRTGAYLISNRSNKFFIGRREVDETHLTLLLSALSTPLLDAPTLADLGIDQQWLDRNADAALGGIAAMATANFNDKSFAPFGEEERQYFQAFFVNRESMDRLLRATWVATDHKSDMPKVEVLISLRQGQTIQLLSGSSGPFLLPWQVKVESRNAFQIFDYRISSAIAALLPKGAPNKDRLCAIGKYELRQQLASELADYVRNMCNKDGCPKPQ